eukprot:TRINITY_DN7178_c0_g1_i3.p1 TRINITY_DN7178_c0_g1~~TRINITY_DN7178_c0_g1_i3.p1  ORF type:complete len:1515 (-),score=294.48 TRINITY_DN7178_c0_g1_i3:52-4542(-)
MGSSWATSDEGVGSWIKFEFVGILTINMMKYANRAGDNKNQDVELTFSDGSSTAVQLEDGDALSSYPFPDKTTSSVKIAVTSVYSTLDNGASEVEFWYQLPLSPGRRAITSCSASSERDSSHSCSKAFDGDMGSSWATSDEGVGSWIKFEFAGSVVVNMMKYANRAGDNKNQDVELTFSDGSDTTVQLKDGDALNSYPFPEKATSSVKIAGVSADSSHGNGASEVEFWYQLFPAPGQRSITSCSASSELDSLHSCSSAIDGDMSSSWASSGEGVGSWVMLDFGDDVVINAMKYANRAGNHKNQGADLTFSDGSSTAVQLKDDTALNIFTFPEKTTTSVSIIITSIYSGDATHNNGAEEIEFWYLSLSPGRRTVTSCSASSELDFSHPCSKSMDGDLSSSWATSGQGLGSWIKFEFAGAVIINMMKYANRGGKNTNQDVELTFSDGSSTTVRLKDDAALNSFPIPETTTTSVKIVVASVYSTDNNGAQEIEFWYEAPVIAQQGMGWWIFMLALIVLLAALCCFVVRGGRGREQSGCREITPCYNVDAPVVQEVLLSGDERKVLPMGEVPQMSSVSLPVSSVSLQVQEKRKLTLAFMGRASGGSGMMVEVVSVTQRPVGMTFKAESFPFVVEEITEGSELHINGNIQKGMELVRYRWETKRGDGDWQPQPWVDMPHSGIWQDGFKSFTYELTKLPGHDTSEYKQSILHLAFGENGKAVKTVPVTRKPVGMTFRADSFPFIVEDIAEGSELHQGSIKPGMQFLRYQREDQCGSESQLHPWKNMPVSGNWGHACTRFTDELEKLPGGLGQPLVDRKHRVLVAFRGDGDEVKTVYITQWPCGATFQSGSFPFIVEHVAEGSELDQGGIKRGMQFLSYRPEEQLGGEWQLQPFVDMPPSSNWEIVHKSFTDELTKLSKESSSKHLVGELPMEEKRRLVLGFGRTGTGGDDHVHTVPVTQRPVGMTFKAESFPFVVEEITEGSELHNNGNIQKGMELVRYRWETKRGDGDWQPQPWVVMPLSGNWLHTFKSFTYELTKLPGHDASGYKQSFLLLAFGENGKAVKTVLVTHRPVGMTFRADSFPFIVEDIAEGSELHQGSIKPGMQFLRYRWENRQGNEKQLTDWVRMPLSGNWGHACTSFTDELEKLSGEPLVDRKHRVLATFRGDGNEVKTVYITQWPCGVTFQSGNFPFIVEHVAEGSELDQGGIKRGMQFLSYQPEVLRGNDEWEEWQLQPCVDMPPSNNWETVHGNFVGALANLPAESSGANLVGKPFVEEQRRLLLAFGTAGTGDANYVNTAPVTQRPVGITFKAESFPFLVEEITEGSELHCSGIQSGMQFLCYCWETKRGDGDWQPQPWVNLALAGNWQYTFKTFTYELAKLPGFTLGYKQQRLEGDKCRLILEFDGSGRKAVTVTHKPVGIVFKVGHFPFSVERVEEGCELQQASVETHMQLMRYRWETMRGDGEWQVQPWVDLPLSGNWQHAFKMFADELQKLPGEGAHQTLSM